MSRANVPRGRADVPRRNPNVPRRDPSVPRRDPNVPRRDADVPRQGASGPELLAFLGPSLPRAEAEELIHAEVKHLAAPLAFSIEPPAQKGDVERALGRAPRVLALIDGLFESVPSVWPKELLAAIERGVVVFGASSMGALRAAELRRYGMIGVGEIFARYRDGFDDDAAVALLHGDAESGYRPLTVPLVNAEHAIAEAGRAGLVSPAEAKRLLHAARETHYQERRWELLLESARLAPRSRERWDAFAARGLPDAKADDARLCLREAARRAIELRARTR